MKNFHQNLLIALALCLCALCACQWYSQTQQRKEMISLNQLLYEKSSAIQGYTNSIRNMDKQIAQMDASLGQLKDTIKSNEAVQLDQRREISRLRVENESQTNQIAQYQQAVDKLESNLKEAYDGIKKQNAAIKELTSQRDEFVQKLNDAVKERNDVVNKYNDLVKSVEKQPSK
jgi:chromosome segregation ATPase